MAGQLYEIMTKATISKGFKKTMNKYEFSVDHIDKILGCWISNHQFQGSIVNGEPQIDGDFDIHLWYSYDNDSFLLKQQIHYSDKIDLSAKNHQISKKDEIIADCLHLPKCINAKLQENVMIIEIEKEMALKIVGDTTILVESKSNDLENELDINPDFIT